MIGYSEEFERTLELYRGAQDDKAARAAAEAASIAQAAQQGATELAVVINDARLLSQELPLNTANLMLVDYLGVTAFRGRQKITPRTMAWVLKGAVGGYNNSTRGEASHAATPGYALLVGGQLATYNHFEATDYSIKTGTFRMNITEGMSVTDIKNAKAAEYVPPAQGAHKDFARELRMGMVPLVALLRR